MSKWMGFFILAFSSLAFAGAETPDFSVEVQSSEYYRLSHKKGDCRIVWGERREKTQNRKLALEECIKLFKANEKIFQAKNPPLSDYFNEQLPTAEVTVQVGSRQWQRTIRIQHQRECTIDLVCEEPEKNPLFPLVARVLSFAP